MPVSAPSNVFASAHASASAWRDALEQCLRTCAVPAGAGLGFVYATDHFAAELGAIRDELVRRTGVAHWVGTVGMGICADGREYFDVPALAIMVCGIDPRHFRLLSEVSTAAEAAAAAVDVGKATPNFAVVHADPANAQLPEMLHALSRRLESGFMVGGISSSRRGTPQLAAGVESGGLSGVVFSDDVVVATRLTQGCAAVGPRHTITRAYRNVVITLDDRPALEVLREDAATCYNGRLENVAQHVFAGLPVRGADTDDYLVRHIIGIDARQQFVAVAENLQQGDRLFFCTRDRASASDDLERMLRSIKSGLYHAPRGALYYTCLGRGPNLFEQDSEELRIIRDHLGEVPLVGFFGNGEISHDRLYGYTGVLTLFL